MTFTKISNQLYLFLNESYYDVVVGAIVLPNKIALIDTGIDADELLEFRKFVENETNKKCELVFITHYHGDHTVGLSALEDCEIILSEKSFEKIKEKIKAKKIIAKNYLEIMDDNVKIIFKNTGGHSKDSSYIFCPNYKLLFAGDNLFQNMFPYGQDETSDPDLWLKVFEEYLELDSEKYIPGHQNIIDKSIIKGYINFIQKLHEKMMELKDKGMGREEIISETKSLNPFDDTKDYEKLEMLKIRTLENWYEHWMG